MSDNQKKLSQTTDDPLSKRDPNKREWVKFEDDSGGKESSVQTVVNVQEVSSELPAVIPTESIHVTIENVPKTKESLEKNQNGKGQDKSQGRVSEGSAPVMRNVELSTERIQEGFVNGEIIVTLLPVNVNWPWITPAVFRPELVPEELMAQGLTLTVEEYVHCMEILVNDYRFTLYNVCYKRVLMLWISLAFCVLLGLLFSGITGILLFSLGVGWLFLNASAIFFCMWIKLKLARGLEQCLAKVNSLLMKHKIIIALDDRGNISCHKINLCFIYFDPSPCIQFINQFLERSEQNGQQIEQGWESRLDVERNDIIIQGSSNTRVPRKQNFSELILLRYVSRWGHDLLRNFLKVSNIEPGRAGRHMSKNLCPCQFIECHLKCKPPKGMCCWCFPQFSEVNHMYPY